MTDPSQSLISLNSLQGRRLYSVYQVVYVLLTSQCISVRNLEKSLEHAEGFAVLFQCALIGYSPDPSHQHWLANCEEKWCSQNGALLYKMF